MQSNFKNKELLRLLLKCFMTIYGLKYRTKAVALKKKSKSIKISQARLSQEYATFDNKKGHNKENT